MRHFYGITESPDACEVTSRELIVSRWPVVLTVAAALLDRKGVDRGRGGGLTRRDVLAKRVGPTAQFRLHC